MGMARSVIASMAALAQGIDNSDEDKIEEGGQHMEEVRLDLEVIATASAQFCE